MRRLLIAALLLAGCVDKPDSFGVNVEVVTSSLDEGLKGQIVTLGLHVRGAEKFDKDSIGDVSALVKEGSVKFHYVPGAQSGTLSFAIDGLDANNTIVASGAAPPVGLVAGKAVDVTVTLMPGDKNGQPGVPCQSNDTCITGFCVDGVCCDTRCDGTCESCSLTGTEGTCSPIAMGTDPNMECQAKITPDDGGTDSDGGAVQPDGGQIVMLTPQMCAGTCNGNRACSYPGQTQTCGAPFCSDQAVSASFVCDGAGSCTQKVTSCADYACAMTGSCATSCNANTDCSASDFCNLNLQQCVPKRTNGTGCMNGYECQSGFCANNFCCNSACNAAGMSCNNAGKEGQCQCTGVTCDPGVACQIWYPDSDNDTYGDSSATLGNGLAKIGCESGSNAPPAGAKTKDNTDCDDGDPRAHPGGGFYNTPRTTKGGYDFNCDGTSEHQTVYLNASCQGSCAEVHNVNGTIGCMGYTSCTGSVTGYLGCGTTFNKFGGICLCCGITTAGYITDTAAGAAGCGQSASYRTCSPCSGTGFPTSTTTIGMACR